MPLPRSYFVTVNGVFFFFLEIGTELLNTVRMRLSFKGQIRNAAFLRGPLFLKSNKCLKIVLKIF
jgi:hypothetical protein